MGWMMRSSKNPPEDDRSVQSLKVSLEIIANLIYLSRRTETHCAQQHVYLDRATKVMTEIANRPRLIGKIIEVVPLSEVTEPVSCEEKTRLVKEYDDATLAFSDAVQELRRKIGTSPKAEYERLERISSKARVKSEQTRLALEQHIASHHC
jgi:hypothetical protein